MRRRGMFSEHRVQVTVTLLELALDWHHSNYSIRMSLYPSQKSRSAAGGWYSSKWVKKRFSVLSAGGLSTKKVLDFTRLFSCSFQKPPPHYLLGKLFWTPKSRLWLRPSGIPQQRTRIRVGLAYFLLIFNTFSPLEFQDLLRKPSPVTGILLPPASTTLFTKILFITSEIWRVPPRRPVSDQIEIPREQDVGTPEIHCWDPRKSLGNTLRRSPKYVARPPKHFVVTPKNPHELL